MSHRGQEPQPGYMDGVHVKISERYKPPPRINLAVTYSQRLSLNKQIQDNNLIPYDFSLEVNVKDRIKELRNARRLMHEEKKDRLEKVKEARRKYEESRTLNEHKNLNSSDQEAQMLSVNSEPTSSQAVPLNSTQTQQVLNVPTANSSVLYPAYSHILTPTPLMNIDVSKSYRCDPADKSPFNISDFEADTSSPFDNMELKTINDIEELAQVLKKDDAVNTSFNTPYSATQVYSNYVPLPNISTHSAVQPNYMNSNTQYIPYNIPHSSVTSVSSYGPTTATTIYNNINGYYFTPEVLQANSSFNPYNTVQSDNLSDDSPPQTKFEESKPTSFRSVPDIMKALQVELDNTHIHNRTNNTTVIENHTQNEIVHLKKSIDVTKELDGDESYKLLPKNLQHLSRNISSMGFPLSRVARACQVLGDDHKKIVEHLLAMSELLDLGFSEKDVSSALLQCNNDRDKALDILIS